ncbi:MAG TPA: hemerythrin domain-containing protein [Acidimicrobiia bacterium]|jgi:hemerythrin superfamily protein
MMITGIDLLLAEHRRVEELFAQYSKAPSAGVAALIFADLEAHDEAETAALYPLARALLGDDAVDPALLAHAEVKTLIDTACALEGPPLDAAMKLLQKKVAAHVADEEKHLFPALAKAATDDQLTGLGARAEQVKQRVG